MLRRHAIASLLALPSWAKTLDTQFAGAHGGAVVLDRRSHRVIAEHLPDLAAHPGSTLKPLVLQILLERGRLHARETFPCPVDLRLHGRSFACTHPPSNAPITVPTAIAYSCNCFVAHFAARLTAAELARELDAYGIESPPAGVELQALGEAALATPASLAGAYARLAARAADAVKTGMADAVAYGTAQRAQVPGLPIAGKTGTARNAAWFAGFTDSLALAVLVQGRSGGADAAPIAARILRSFA
jgi:cell division protein FtsI/penicillin-binding protein 2